MLLVVCNYKAIKKKGIIQYCGANFKRVNIELLKIRSISDLLILRLSE